MEEILKVLEQVKKEKGVSEDVLINAVEESLKIAYEKEDFRGKNLVIKVEQKSGKILGFLEKVVVEKVENENNEIEISSARKLGFTGKIGDTFLEQINLKSLGRGATYAAKQAILKRIKEAEWDVIYNNFKEKEGTLLSGVIQRIENRNIMVDLHGIEGILPLREQVESEKYNFRERYKFYVLEVRKTDKGPQVILSRTHPNLIRRLFEAEVPEIKEKIVEIKSIARLPGIRTKIAVVSNNEKIDPVGTCIGGRGLRIQEVINEVRGEKIDVIKYSDDLPTFIAASLSPAKIKEIKINETERKALVVVFDDQLSIAIGKGGQNVKLAGRLVNLEIDILTETQYSKLGKEEEKREEKQEENKT